MKALSLSRPWTTAVEVHGKLTENRERWTPHPHLMAQARKMIGQDLALHSSGTYDRKGALYIERQTGVLYGRKDTPDKAVTSVVHVTGVLHPGDPCPPGQERWYFGDTALQFENVRILTAPVYMAGGLGFWTIKEPYLPQVLAALPQPEPTCVDCSGPVDPRHRCVNCRQPVCIHCASYDDDADLRCGPCHEDIL